jgi:hypothetical protein
MSTTLTRTLRTTAELAPHASGLRVENEEQSIFAFVTSTSRDRRPDTPRRVTPDLIEFYRKRDHDLRGEYYRNFWRAVWALLMRIGRR